MIYTPVATTPSKARYRVKTTQNVPILENGDCLVREEFERRYAAMPELKKAELIEGRVYMASAVRRDHGKAHGDIMAWLGGYYAMTPGIHVYDNATVEVDDRNELQPDAALRIESDAYNPDWRDTGQYIEHAPQLIVEVAGSSASYDLHEKLIVYQRFGVKEYVVWQLYENQLDWFQLVQGKYERLPPDADQVVRSRIFPGLYLAVEALLAGDMETVFTTLQQGLQSEQHQVFVRYLQGNTE